MATDSSFGLFVPQLGMEPDEVLTAAQQAESAGFGSFWLMDHLYTPGAPAVPALESWTMLTAVATATSTLRIGHLVGCNPIRHPAVLAKMAATLDRISAGRLDLGLGWGSVEDEFATFGFDVGTRRERSARLAETIEIVRLMFGGQPFDYAGDHFTLRGAQGSPTPVQPRVPIHIGGGGRRLTMPLVARHADWWNCVGGARPRFDELAPLRGDARISAQYAVGLVTDERMRAKVVERTGRRMPATSWGPPLVGSPEELRAMFLAEAERGVDLMIVRFHDRAEPDTIDVFGREVIAPVQEVIGSARTDRRRDDDTNAEKETQCDH